MKDIFIFGVARSGKTTLANELAEKFGYSIISIDSIVDSFEKTFPQIGIAHSNSQLKFDTLPKLVAAFYEKFKKEYPQRNFVIEGWHVFPKDIFKYLHLDNFISVCLGYPNQKVSEKLSEIRRFSSDNDYCKHLTDERLREIIEKHIKYSKEMAAQCAPLQIPFFDLSNDWDGGQAKVRKYIFDKIS